MLDNSDTGIVFVSYIKSHHKPNNSIATDCVPIMLMNNPLITWDLSGLSYMTVDQILDLQRDFQAKLVKGDIFYSRTDLHMYIDRCRNEARANLLELYSEAHHVDSETSSDLVLHAAAWGKISSLNIIQLIKDYPDLLRHQNGPNGSLPLHIAVTAVGDGHFERVEPFLDLYPQAAKCLDENRLLPLQNALISGAGYDVISLLLNTHIDAIKQMILPRYPVHEKFTPFVGLLPFHVACCCCSEDVIYSLLINYPECLIWSND